MKLYKSVGNFGVATRTELLDSGLSWRTISALESAGSLRRIDRTRYALPGANADVVQAASGGATLTCLSALALHGIETVPLRQLHLRRHRYSNRKRDSGLGTTCALRGFDAAGPVDSLDKALLAAIRNHDPEIGVLALDSILNTRKRTRAELEAIVRAIGSDGPRLLSRADARCESALESIVRSRLRSRRIRFRIQVQIDGVGRVDFLLGKRLIIETDGKKFHSQNFSLDPRKDPFEEDRRRDRAAVALGYIVIRLTWRQVMEDWNQVIADILTIVRADAHRYNPMATAEHCSSSLTP